MDLKDTVELFCTEQFTDHYDPLATFMGRLNPFAEITNSGTSAQRRILETVTGTPIPAERVVITPEGQYHVVGHKNIDYWFGNAIRDKYSTMLVSSVPASVGSAYDVLNGVYPDDSAFCAIHFVRREISEDNLSDYFSGYELYFPNTKNFTRGSIVYFAGYYYRLKTDTWVDAAGFSVAQAMRLEHPLKTHDLTNKNSAAYNPVTDTFGSNTIVGIECFMEFMSENYEFVSPAFEKIHAGDQAISILKAAADLEAGDLVGPYRVLAKRDMGDWAVYHCRR